MLPEAAPMGLSFNEACHGSMRREDCAKSIYRYATRGEGSAWAVVPPDVKQHYRRLADSALAVADATRPTPILYAALEQLAALRGRDWSYGSSRTDAGKRWKAAEEVLALLRDLGRLALGDHPERLLEARKLHATDAALRAESPTVELGARYTLSPRGTRTLIDLNGNEVEP